MKKWSLFFNDSNTSLTVLVSHFFYLTDGSQFFLFFLFFFLIFRLLKIIGLDEVPGHDQTDWTDQSNPIFKTMDYS